MVQVNVVNKILVNFLDKWLIDLLWCGSCALKDLTRKIVDASDSLRILQHDQKEKEKELEIERKLSASLQKKLKE